MSKLFETKNWIVTSKLLGSGSYGHVFEAINEKTKNKAACKRVKSESAQVEMKVLKAAFHPNIISLLHHFVVDKSSQHYLFFPLYDQTLFNFVRSKEYKPDRLVIRNIMLQLVSAMAYLNSTLNYVHLDLKPDNILIKSKNEIVVSDFGMSEKIGSRVDKTFTGTLQYRSPETFITSSKYVVSIELDSWALGLVFFFLCTSRDLFDPKNITNQHAQFHKNPLAFVESKISSSEKNILGPDGLDLLLQLLSVDPQNRLCTFSCQFHPFLMKK